MSQKWERVIMSATGLEVFDETVQKTNTWLKEIGEALEGERPRAYQALRAVLHALRDRLSLEEAAHLGGQLPMLVRGIYYESWRPAANPSRVRSLAEFLSDIGLRLPTAAPIDPGDAARAVFQTLHAHITPGEIRHVVANLPLEIRQLWPHVPDGGRSAA
jgi:uncharacterized protein (DUF2267 family)